MPQLQRLFPGITVENLSALQTIGETRQDLKMAWNIAKRLTGIRPLIAPPGQHWTRQMSEEKVALVFRLKDVNELRYVVSLLQSVWTKRMKDIADGVLPPKEEAPKPAAAEKVLTPSVNFATSKQQCTTQTDGRLTSEQMRLLHAASFTPAIFDCELAGHDVAAEAEWFCGRIDEIRKAFEEPRAKGVAQMALLNELKLRRINARLLTLDPSKKAYGDLHDIATKLESTYGEQWAQLEELCPQAITSRKETIRIFSDLVRLWEGVSKDPNRLPRDGIFTDDEIQVLLRTSVQQPECQYRLGWVLACNEARLGLTDPKWKRRMNKTQCKLLDSSFAYAVRRLEEKYGVGRPDLESDGPDGEYPDIYTEADGEMTAPEDIETKPVENTAPVEIAETV